MNDELGFVVQAFNGTVVDGHAEVVEDVLLVAAQHPGEVSQRCRRECVAHQNQRFRYRLAQPARR